MAPSARAHAAERLANAAPAPRPLHLELTGASGERARLTGSTAGVAPVVVTLAFEGDRTMMGLGPEDAAKELAARGVAAIGANCGGGYPPVERAIARMRAAAPGLPLVAKANAGMPVAGLDGVAHFPGTPEDAAAHARRALDAGASVVGGCCGSSPAHVAAIAAVLAEA